MVTFTLTQANATLFQKRMKFFNLLIISIKTYHHWMVTLSGISHCHISDLPKAVGKSFPPLPPLYCGASVHHLVFPQKFRNVSQICFAAVFWERSQQS